MSTAPSVNAAAAAAPRLKYFPLSWFSMVMGLTGFTIAVGKGEKQLGWPGTVSLALLVLTALIAMLLTGLYALKIVRHRSDVVEEIRHPVKLAFVPTFSISLILLSVATLHAAPQLSAVLWAVGAVVHLGLTLYVLSSWMHHDRYQIQHLNPAWFIPVVGNILVPIAGIHHAPPEVSWFFLSIGLFFWPLLSAILFYRLIFHGSLPERLVPTLFIFIAPPAAGFISYVNVTGSVDGFARILFSIAVFFTLLLFTQWRMFSRLKFFLSWWAFSFPLAAMTIAGYLMAERTGSPLIAAVATVGLAALSVLIVGLLGRTALAVSRREICVEGH